MNELFKDKLATVDDLLLQAIKAVFDGVIEEQRPIEWTDDNAMLGEKYRAYLQAKKIIDKGFSDLKSYKITKAPIKQFNKEI